MDAVRKKMNRGNLENALQKALHHLSSGTFMMAFEFSSRETVLDYRFRIISEEIQEALTRIKRIRQIATEQGYSDVLTILDERFPFGHDITD